MSRCFPYPPPGYTLSRASNEALIESIEPQNEREKSIKEHKQKSKKEHKEKREKSKKEHKEKREKSKKEHKEKDKEQRKKEKEQRKKDKEKERKDKKDKTHQNLKKADGVLSNVGEKLWTNTKSDLLQKGCEAQSEQLEQSILTEEHGQAVCPNAPSCSSDSTENSNKRKRQSSPEDISHVHGKIIRIKLSKKPDDSGPSTSGRAQLPTQSRNDIGLEHIRDGLSSTSNERQGIPSRIVEEQNCTTSQQIKMVATGKTDLRKPTKVPMSSPMQKMEWEYKNLFENLVQPQLLDASLPDDDLDWLIPTKIQDRSIEKKQTSGNASMTCSGSQTLWPCVQYLQEVDVYALPYTVPF